FLDLARQDGWDVHGIEPSPRACRTAKERYGLDLEPTTLDDFSAADRFDVIYLSHVFEHLPRPSAALEKIRSLLAPDGLLLIEVPNQFDALIRRIVRWVRVGRRAPRTFYSIHHPLFFGPRQLAALLRRHDFAVNVRAHVPTDFPRTPRGMAKRAVNAVGAAAGRQGDPLQVLASPRSAAGSPSPSG
ncbi:MAG: class I SAM-dependent methyltransferase, partial [Actinomycetota bacterium]|nr:class I SAM-dependent methyltransferase [Actinomycetota bacterium]